MVVINNVTNMPVIRPVACLDKLEIIEISKKITINANPNPSPAFFILLLNIFVESMSSPYFSFNKNS